jgi:hypothetical protein
VPVSRKSTLSGGMLSIMVRRLIGAIGGLWLGGILLLSAPAYGAPVCVGDCNGDGTVTIDELITGVSIVLGPTPIAECAVLDTDGTGQVDVSRLIMAVNNALGSCPAGVGDAAIGTVVAMTRAVASTSSFALGLTAAVNASVNTSPAGICPQGGTNAQTCQDLGGGRVSLPLSLSDCGFATADGVVRLDGTVTLSGKGYCPGTLLPSAIDVDFVLTATLGEPAAPVKISQYALHGALGGIVFGSAPCAIAGGRITVSGSATDEIPGRGSGTVQMHAARLTLLFSEFSPKCEPAVSTIRLDGSVSVEDAFGTEPFAFDAVLGNFGVVQRADATGGTSAEVSGAVNAACTGGQIDVATSVPLRTSSGEPCATAGRSWSIARAARSRSTAARRCHASPRRCVCVNNERGHRGGRDETLPQGPHRQPW